MNQIIEVVQIVFSQLVRLIRPMNIHKQDEICDKRTYYCLIGEIFKMSN